jgi:hypothetical protein
MNGVQDYKKDTRDLTLKTIVWCVGLCECTLVTAVAAVRVVSLFTTEYGLNKFVFLSLRRQLCYQAKGKNTACP